MPTVKFRRTLRGEVDRWRSEGIIDSNLHAIIADRYHFEKLAAESSSSFTNILIGLGFVLIGLGILSFVATNWQYWDKPARIAVLLSTFLSVNIGGFYLWKRSSHQRLAKGLLLLGGVVLGANMALLAQLFHISGNIFVLFAGWSIGVAVMSYALRLTPLGVMAIGLMGCSYVTAAFAGEGDRAIAPLWANLLSDYMPICVLVMFLPLAYRCRSAAIFLLSGIFWLYSYQAGSVSYTFSIFGNPGYRVVDRIGLILSCCLPPLLLWAYGRLQSYLISASYAQKITELSCNLAIFSAVLTCFTLSLPGMHYILIANAENRLTYVNNWISTASLFVPITIGGWIWLWKLSSRWQMSDLQMSGFGLVIGGLLTIATNWQIDSTIITSAFFLLLAVATLTYIYSSLKMGNRGVFYFGWSFLSLRILCWFAFVQTGLGLKAILFIICGVVTIAIGIWFEKRMRSSRLLAS
jgi:uncharacterized membrane protein